MTKVFLGLGGNQGDRFAALKCAIDLLKPHIHHLKQSAIYESPALLLTDSPPEWNIHFLNMAIAGDTDLEPEALLTEIKRIEKQMGRGNDYPKWSPRSIDIDILLYGDTPYQSETLTIPHPLINEREFVWLPLTELDHTATPPLRHNSLIAPASLSLRNEHDAFGELKAATTRLGRFA